MAHPDKGGSVEESQLLNKAKEVLLKDIDRINYIKVSKNLHYELFVSRLWRNMDLKMDCITLWTSMHE